MPADLIVAAHTKLRALYQRKQGRDLFDLAIALKDKRVTPERVVECFLKYMKHDELTVSRAEFEQNLADKLDDAEFLAGISPLLAPEYQWSRSQKQKPFRRS